MAPTWLGPLIKARETLAVFASSAPSPRELLRNRTQRIDRLHPILPSTATPGEPLSLTVQAWDQCERLHRTFDGGATVDVTAGAARHPDRVSFDPGDEGVLRGVPVTFQEDGLHYVTLTREGTGERFVSNPVRVAADHDARVYWGDIHVHSRLSDGAGRPETGYRFARDTMALDIAAYADHDTMGFFIPPSWQRDRMHGGYFDRLCSVAERFNDDGSFVALPAYEWTKQPNQGGHLNVYFEDPEAATLFDSLAPETDTYEGLWDRLREWDAAHDSGVVTVPHHSAEAMYPFDFAGVDYDDEMAPLVEVYSQWGSSEYPGREGNEFAPAMGQGEVDTAGHHVRDAHRLGYRVGMVGSSDFHGPAPGHSTLHAPPHLPSLSEWRRGGVGWGPIWRVWNEPSYPGGLAAFLAPELTREAVFSALRSRSVYATTQPDRILVEFSVDGVDVAAQDDAVVVEDPATPRAVSVAVAGTAPIERVTVTKNTEPWRTLEGTADPGADLSAYRTTGEWTDETPVTGVAWDEERGSDGDVYALRVRQASSDAYPGMAWVGPLWVEVAGGEPRASGTASEPPGDL